MKPLERVARSGSWGGAARRRFSRSTAAMLLCVVVAGYVALGVASSGSFFEGPSVRVFLQYLATPILIGLAQMVRVPWVNSTSPSAPWAASPPVSWASSWPTTVCPRSRRDRGPVDGDSHRPGDRRRHRGHPDQRVHSSPSPR